MYTYPLIPVCIHDIRDPSLQADALHPMSRQFLCNWRDEGHDGCRNHSVYAIEEFGTLGFVLNRRKTLLMGAMQQIIIEGS